MTITKNMASPHIVYKHGDKIRLYSPSLVITITPDDEKYCANLMYLPYTSVAWETMYIVYDGSYYFSRAVPDEKTGAMVGDGRITQAREFIPPPGAIDPADAAILSDTSLVAYATESIATVPRAMLCIDGTRCIIGPDVYVSDNREVDIISCPIELQPMYLGIETFDAVFMRLAERESLLSSYKK